MAALAGLAAWVIVAVLAQAVGRCAREVSLLTGRAGVTLAPL